MAEKKETVNSQAVEALTETFKKRGWDSSIPKILSEWEGFYCNDSTFSVEIKNEDGKITSVCLLEGDFPSEPSQRDITAVIKWGWNGRNLQIRACPVSLIFDTFGSDGEEAIGIMAPWERQVYRITRSGRLEVSRNENVNLD